MLGLLTSFSFMAVITYSILYVHCTDELVCDCAHEAIYMNLRNERMLKQLGMLVHRWIYDQVSG